MQRTKTLIILVAVLIVAVAATLIVKNTETKKEDIKNTAKMLTEIDPETLSSVSWTCGEKSFSFKKNGDEWAYEADSNFPVDGDKIESLMAPFGHFAASFIIENVSDYSQYGLKKPCCIIEFTADSEDYRVSLGDFSTMDSKRYVSLGDGCVYLVSDDPYNAFDVDLSAVILNDDVPDLTTVSAVSFSGSEKYDIVMDEAKHDSYCDSDIFYAKLGDKTVPLDSEKVLKYGRVLSGLSLTDYISYNLTENEKKLWGLDDPLLTIDADYLSTSEDNPSGSFTVHIGVNQEDWAKKTETEKDGSVYDGELRACVRVGDSPIIYNITSGTYKYLMAASSSDFRHSTVFTADFANIEAVDISFGSDSCSISAESDKEDSKYFVSGKEIDISDFKSKFTSLAAIEYTDDLKSDKEELSMDIKLSKTDVLPAKTMKLVFYRVDGSRCLVYQDAKPLCYVDRSSVVDLIEAVNTIILG